MTKCSNHAPVITGKGHVALASTAYFSPSTFSVYIAKISYSASVSHSYTILVRPILPPQCLGIVMQEHKPYIKLNTQFMRINLLLRKD
jgi:hypothetical protein